jgi:hypothetical protein
MRETSGMQIYSVRLRADSETGPQIGGLLDLSWVHRLPFKPHNLKVFSRDDQRQLKRLIARSDAMQRQEGTGGKIASSRDSHRDRVARYTILQRFRRTRRGGT